MRSNNGFWFRIAILFVGEPQYIRFDTGSNENDNNGFVHPKTGLLPQARP